jgi:hypothetical protein
MISIALLVWQLGNLLANLSELFKARAWYWRESARSEKIHADKAKRGEEDEEEDDDDGERWKKG